MAYDFSFATDKVIVDGRRLLRVTLSETGVEVASEAVITGLPRFGTIVRYKATLTPVAAATIHPALGRVPAFLAESQDEISQNETPAVHIDNQNLVRYYTDQGVIIVRSTPDVDGDDIETEFYISTGWDL